MLAGRWWKNTSNQIPDNGKTEHVVPKLSRRVFIGFCIKGEGLRKDFDGEDLGGAALVEDVDEEGGGLRVDI